MTPKDKAEEIYEQHMLHTPYDDEVRLTKIHANITVDYLINISGINYKDEMYWQDVKKELELI